jgi:hypothetical protein
MNYLKQIYYYILLLFFPSWNFGSVNFKWAWYWSHYLALKSMDKKNKFLESWQDTFNI